MWPAELFLSLYKIRKVLSLLCVFSFTLSAFSGWNFPEKAFASTSLDACGTLSIPGETYILSISIGSGGTCITVEAEGVIIDGAGLYTITGNIVSAGYSLTVKNVTVGNITTTGSYAGGAVTIIDSTTGDISTVGGTGTVNGNDALNPGENGSNGESGFAGGAVHITDSTVGTVTTNGGTATSNGGGGGSGSGDSPCTYNGGSGGASGSGGAGGNITTVNSTTGTKIYSGGSGGGVPGPGGSGGGGDCSDGGSGSSGSTGADGTVSNITSITISSIANVASAAQTTATITWTTDVLSSSQVEYGLTNSYGSVTELNPTETYSHQVDLTGLLSPLTSYNFRVISAGSTYGATSSDRTLLTNYDSKWGSSGSGNGAFSLPTRIAVDSSGNIYVAESGNSRIQKFDSSGTYVAKWGSLGSGNGQFSAPRGITIDSSGYIYVADTNNNRIQKFDSSGVYVTKWGSSGSGNGQFSSPFGIDIDSSGNIYVAESGNSRIQKFDSSGTYVAKWGSLGSGNGQFNALRDIAIDSSNNIYVVESGNNRIQKFDTSGAYVTKWGSSGTSNGQFSTPYGVATDSSGNVYVADTANHRIQRFDSSGTYLNQWGSLGVTGTGNGQFNNPYGITTDSSDNVYVVDYGNSRIQKFDSINDTTAPSAPGTPDMTGATDSGVSSSDNTTSDTTPNFTMSCESSAVVSLRESSTLLGTSTCASSTVTITSSSLSDGAHSIIATQADLAGNVSATSSALAINIDSTAPTITNVSSDKATGTYATGEVIDIDVTFSEVVTSTGNVTVTLETGSTDRTCTFSVTASTTGTCNYTVQSGDTSADLTTNSISGTIADTAGNAMSNFTPLTNLAANAAITIDTTAPAISEITPITTPTDDSTPEYTFTTDEAGTITYGGSCSSLTTSASSGSNSIILVALIDGTYSDCTITVTDAPGNISSTLTITSFTIDTVVESSGSGSTGGGQTGGGSVSSYYASQAPAPTPTPLNTFINSISNFVPSFLRPNSQKGSPVVATPVREEPELVLENGWSLIPNDLTNRFILDPLPEEIANLISKFPELGKVFTSIGVTNMSDLDKLQNVTFNLPKVVDKTNPPTDMVFAKSGEGQIDIGSSIEVVDGGTVEQKIHTLGGKPITLQIKPGSKTASVKGHLTFKRKSEQAIINVPASSLVASVIVSVGSLGEKKLAPVTIEEKLLIFSFDYIDPDGDGIYSADIKTPQVEGEYEIITIINYADKKNTAKELRMVTVIDPEGYIYEKDKFGREIRISDAEVSLFEVDSSGRASLWDAKKYSQENPQMTNKTGKYSFLVPEGDYYIAVKSDGHGLYKGEMFPVREGNPVHENIELVKKHSWLRNLLDWKTGVLLIIIAIYITHLIDRRKKI